MATLQFATWTTDIDLGFYASLANLKINHDKLDSSARKALGLYEIRPQDIRERSCRMQIHSNALTTDQSSSQVYRGEGIFKNVNTIEEYKKIDRQEVLERAGRTIWDAINDATVYECPSLLASFYAVCYADLKKYKFTYHFAYPAIHSDPPWKNLDDRERKLPTKETTALVDAVQTWRYQTDVRQHGFFLAKRFRKGILSGTAAGEPADGEPPRPEEPKTPGTEELEFQWVISSLSGYDDKFFSDADAEDQFIAFADPSTYSDNPGWMLRNLLVLLRQRWKLRDAQILCYRDTHLRRDQANSIILHLQSEQVEPAKEMPKVSGWERNHQGKLNSRLVDLGEYMDPAKLADQAVDLNLKLIKWRIAPSIDLDVVKNTKCLLLGAGTLGSYVSRNLMGWGVRKISFIDNARVSFSNPVRQPLFDFKDCLEGGVKKAQRAADALQEIYPGVDASGHVMSVPMAGHPIATADEAKVKAEFDLLKELIDQHDAIFLLMDTRESRWLPTVMGKAAGKIVLNAALGFDTYVVMRHGLKPTQEGQGEEEVGCYFCNDVVAPADSLKDATLDQQCTVTRPGIAPIASALLVEMLVSVLQHPLKARAPATKSSKDEATAAFMSTSTTGAFQHPLGELPHQLRGFLSSFSTLSIKGKPYDCCSACSDTIVNKYNEEGWDFVKRAINEKGWVEEISGLAEVQRRAEEADKDLEWSEDEAEDGEGELL